MHSSGYFLGTYSCGSPDSPSQSPCQSQGHSQNVHPQRASHPCRYGHQPSFSPCVKTGKNGFFLFLICVSLMASKIEHYFLKAASHVFLFFKSPVFLPVFKNVHCLFFIKFVSYIDIYHLVYLFSSAIYVASVFANLVITSILFRISFLTH